jgi:hypothetical protein
VGRFVAKWDGTERAERANYIPFLSDLCAILGVETPDPAAGSGGAYRYERGVQHHEADGTAAPRRIDLYKRGCFVLEAKQAANPKQADLFGLSTDAERRSAVRRSPLWTQSMLKAKGQAEGYARDLPAEEGWPPFIIVCDVGFCLDVYADFSGTGKHYAQFPDREGFRLYLPDLQKPDVRDRLRAIWTDPHSLDPSRQRVRVTREIAALLARLARALEAEGHVPQRVATFLMRCIFCMFAQSVGLLPTRTAFTDLLEDCRENLSGFVPLVGDLWRTMNNGGFSAALRALVLRFNGGLFAPGPHGPIDPLPVDADMLGLLIMAAKRDWGDVEPAIFGTLLENALDAKQRGELGAHFTPRAFVERLVLPTVMDPLREEWDGVKAAAVTLAEAGDRKGAADLVRAFHARLCTVRVLDPACGTGNFLYVTLELMKRLEGELLDLLVDLVPGEGDRLSLAGASVDPHQFLGLEKNPRAVPVAELVLWIGWLQWHFRTRGSAPPAEPILRDFHNIQEQDALLTYCRAEPDRNKHGELVTRWGGRTKVHPITGEDVPDETDRVLMLRPIKPKPAEWPSADFIIGNPPFIGTRRLRDTLGDGYIEAVWAAHPKVPKASDFVMFWWHRAAKLAAVGKVRRFGLIASNSIDGFYNRKVIQEALTARQPISLKFAVPDHPWSNARGSAAVRISMTVGQAGRSPGKLLSIINERPDGDGSAMTFREETGTIGADLKIGSIEQRPRSLKANERMCFQGCKLGGAGFIILPNLAAAWGLAKSSILTRHIRSIVRGRDITAHHRPDLVIDLYGLSEQDARERLPDVYQHVLLTVKPLRDEVRRQSYRENWWVFQEPRPEMRKSFVGLTRYIATSEVGRHRIFVFLPVLETIPDGSVMVVSSDDAFVFGVLQSRFHTTWTLQASGTLEDRPRYQNQLAFDPFPFPTDTGTHVGAIRAAAEELHAHRQKRLLAHSHLTMTGLYNVLEKLRAGTPLIPAEKDVHDTGQVSILRALHDRLDAAVAAAYGWPADLADAEIVARLVALNAERVAEEAAGRVRWLRPEFQMPRAGVARTVQGEMEVTEIAAGTLRPWPKDTPGQFIALRNALAGGPASPDHIARLFKGAPRGKKLAEMVATLAALGQARNLGGGRFAA